jgi:hypothetical protein
MCCGAKYIREYRERRERSRNAPIPVPDNPDNNDPNNICYAILTTDIDTHRSIPCVDIHAEHILTHSDENLQTALVVIDSQV